MSYIIVILAAIFTRESVGPKRARALPITLTTRTAKLRLTLPLL
jgi:hypothetical protein